MREINSTFHQEQEKIRAEANRTAIHRSLARYTNRPNPKKFRYCKQCGKRHYEITKLYCSKKCKQQANASRPRKKKEIAIGTFKKDTQGYILIYTQNGWTPQHRVIMEEILGRPLKKGETVHHKDGIRHNNNKENLELWIVGVRYGQRATELVCSHCGKPYLVEE